MPTTASTQQSFDADGIPYQPCIERLLSLTAFTSGSSQLSSAIDTKRFSTMRLTAHLTAINANSTLTLKVWTGPTTSPAQAVVNSAGSSTVVLTTGVTTRVYSGLDRYTQIELEEAGASGASTGIFLDGEFC